MATVTLKVKADFARAEKDLKSFAETSEQARKKIDNFQKSFKPVAIDKFIAKNKMAAIAVNATRGKVQGAKAEYFGLRREIERLIKSGMNPQDKALKRLIGDYDRLGKEIGQTSKKTSSLAKAMRAGAVYFSGRAIVSFTGFLLKTASAASELKNKFDVVFKGVRKAADDWIQDYSAAVARGGETTKEFITTLQDIRTGFGDSNKDAAQFSKVVVGVTNDLSSFSNVPFKEASKAIQSGLSGQFIALRRMGVGLNVNIINQGTYAQSLGKTWKQMNNLEKQEAILTGVLQQSKNAVGQNVKSWQEYDFTLGDAAKTSKSFANQSQLTGGLLTDITGIIGSVFLPVANSMLIVVNELLIDFRKWASEGGNLEDILIGVGAVIAGITAGMITYAIATKGVAIATKIWAVAQKGLNVAMKANPIGIIASIIMAVLVPALIWMAKNWDLVKFKISDFADSAKIKLLELTNLIQTKVMKTIFNLYKSFAGLPGMAKLFDPMLKKQILHVVAIRKSIKEAKLQQMSNRQEFAASQERHKKEIKDAQEKADKIKQTNNRIINSNKKAAKEQNKILTESQEKYISTYKMIADSVTTLFSSIGNLMGALTDRRLAILENQMTAELRAAGVLEKTQVQQAQKELIAAQSTGNALDIEEKRRALTKAQIEEKFEKRKRQLQFESAKVAWKFQVAQAAAQVPMAILNGLVTGYGAGFPAGLVLGPLLAGLAGAAAGIQLAAVVASKPSAPSAQTGLENFTVPDIPANRNDRAAVMASAGEEVTVKPRGSGSESTEINIKIGEDVIFSLVQRGIDTGKLNFTNNNINRGVFAT
jgi:hypothetical protein